MTLMNEKMELKRDYVLLLSKEPSAFFYLHINCHLTENRYHPEEFPEDNRIIYSKS